MLAQSLTAAAAGAVSDGATLVAATERKVLDADAERLGVIFSADVADVWVSLGSAAAVANKGFVVRSGYPPVQLHGWNQEIHVISAGAAKLAWTELKASVGDQQGEMPAGSDAFVPSGPSDAAIPPPTAPPPGTPIE